VKKRVYIETSIVSYLAARPSANLVTRARQKITRDWWQEQRDFFDLYASQFVLDEAGDGDPDAARARLRVLATLPGVPLTAQAVAQAREIVDEGLLPPNAGGDAMHLALATVHNMNVLLTWNCRHLANAVILGVIGRFMRIKGYEVPVVCTPDELSGNAGDLGE